MTTRSRKSSIAIAIGVAAALAIWMLSGIGNGPNGTATERGIGNEAMSGGERAMRVMVVRSAARALPREISLSARTEPNRSVELRAETDGRVIGLGAERGGFVETQEMIARLDQRDRPALLQEAEALIVQTRLQYEAAQRLQGQQFVSETQIAEANARLVSAQSTRERIMLDIERTLITAPFDALLQERHVELGDYVKSGDTVAELVDVDPLIIVADINEREVASLEIGMAGHADIGGKLVSGTIRYIAPVAANSTRTFRVELAVPNPEGVLKAGMTAELEIEAGEITAHTLSAALLTLADDGTIGVKTVDEFDRVRFYPATLEGSTDDGVIVTGLPPVATIISVGQGFVIEGQTVTPVQDEAALSSSDNERPY